MERNTIKLDIINKEISVSQRFYKKASNPNSEEYKKLHKVMAENKNFNIAIREAQKCENRNLTFKVMEAYIETQENNEAMLKEFEIVKAVAKAKTRSYVEVKRWFLNKYPKFKEEICDEEINGKKIA